MMTFEEPRHGETAAGTEREHAFPLRELLRVLKSRFWAILLVALVLMGTMLGFSLLQTPRYEASIMILIGQERGDAEAPNVDVMGLQQLTQTMAEAVGTRPVAEEVIRRLDLRTSPVDFLEKDLSVEQVGATQFIEVNYRDTDPERARRVANAVGDVFSEQITEVSPSASAVTATVWEQASPPGDPVSPDLMLNVGAGLALGVVLGIGLAFLLESLDDSWRSPEEVEQISGVPTFGVIPEFDKPRGLTAKGKKGRGG